MSTHRGKPGIDYNSIAAENRTKYGTEVETYGKILLSGLYSQRTYFIYELLQNADDAKASNIHFHVHANRLEVRHNGRPLNHADVQGICGLVSRTKAQDLTQIGRFGIGFKSVFAYTFNHREVKAKQAQAEIFRGLEQLQLEILLFVQHLNAVTWTFEGGAPVSLVRRHKSAHSGQVTHLVKTRGETDERRTSWIIFGRLLREVVRRGAPALKVEIAYALDPNRRSGEGRILPCTGSTLSAFFRSSFPPRRRTILPSWCRDRTAPPRRGTTCQRRTTGTLDSRATIRQVGGIVLPAH